MNQEFKQCLESKKIIPFARGKKLVEKELSIAQSDLSDAKAGYSLLLSHLLGSMVLPKPAGAEIIVSLRLSPLFNCSIRRGRGTIFGGIKGTWSLVFSNGANIRSSLLEFQFKLSNQGAVTFSSYYI